MTISVITPCHNAAKYLNETIESIAAQTRRPFEVILIDDASTDSSSEIARQAAAKWDLNLIVLSADVRNAAAARNIGLRKANGKWIAFLDADDVWYPTHLEHAMAALSDSNDVAYMANHHWYRGGFTEPIPESLRPKIDYSARRLSHLRFPELMTHGFHFGHSTVVYQRDRVREVGGFDESQIRRHDIDLWLRVIADRTWAWGSEPAACYRIDTPGSISKNVIDAEYYYLRALLRNSAAYPDAAMLSLIHTCARRATSLAFVDGSQGQYNRVRPLAWPYLPASFRLVYRIGDFCGQSLRGALRLKRRAYGSCANQCYPTNDQVAPT